MLAATCAPSDWARLSRARSIPPSQRSRRPTRKPRWCGSSGWPESTIGRPRGGGRPPRWTDDELVQLKAAYDLIPPAQRAGLSGVDRRARSRLARTAAARRRFSWAASTRDADATYDTPAPAAHGPPHIHYFDEAFMENSFIASSAPGVGGPGADFALIHETGHAEGNAPERRRICGGPNVERRAQRCNYRLERAADEHAAPAAQHAVVAAWMAAFSAADRAVVAVGSGSIAGPTGMAATSALASEATALAALDCQRRARSADRRCRRRERSAAPVAYQGIYTANDARPERHLRRHRDPLRLLQVHRLRAHRRRERLVR